MTFPIDTKVGDYFLVNDEPVLITAWNYKTHNNLLLYYFDIEFIDIRTGGKMGTAMIMVPMEYDFYMCDIRRMPSLLTELF